MPTDAGSTRDRVIAAAIACFERDGVAATTMHDVAAEAGLSRKTLYRHFADRPTLLLVLLNQRVLALIDILQVELPRFARLEDALVDGLLQALQRSQADTLIGDIINNGSDRRIEALVLDASPEICALLTQAWRPVFARARRSGALTSPLSDERLSEGIRNFLGLLAMRSGMTNEEQRQFLTDFLVPAIMGHVGECGMTISGALDRRIDHG
ncbi:MAG: hypothetical protein RL367_40 [Pseudomonadota bacterium]|jgi:AcrR family transcriptional regulator